MVSKKLAEKMFDMGVSSDIILKLMLEDEVESEASSEEKPASGEEKPEAPKEESKDETYGDPVLKAIESLTGMIAAQNIRRDYRDSQKETADDILAKVLINKGDEK